MNEQLLTAARQLADAADRLVNVCEQALEASPPQTPQAQQQPEPTPGQRWAEENVTQAADHIVTLHPGGGTVGTAVRVSETDTNGHFKRLREYIAAIYDHAQREAAPVWRDAAKEKPPVGKPVVVWWKTQWSQVVAWDGKKWSGCYPYEAATFWMEIPPLA